MRIDSASPSAAGREGTDMANSEKKGLGVIPRVAKASTLMAVAAAVTFEFD